MILKKSLERGQACLEYFILFAGIGILGILTATSFIPRIRDAALGTETQEGYFQKASTAIICADENELLMP